MACLLTDATDFYNFNQATALGHDDNNFDLNSESAPLKTLIKDIVDCQYYDNNTTIFSNEQNLSILHISVRSLNKNFDSFYESFEKTPEIICLSETRIRDKALIHIEISSYSFIHSNSVTCAGGVEICISDKCKYILSDEVLQFTLDQCKNQ